MAYSLQDKVIFITGAAGGIGAATARALHAHGARLVLADMRLADAERLADALGADRAMPVALDVRDLAATQAVVQRAVDRFGRLDVVFANAGIAWARAPGTVMSCEVGEFERIVEVDFLGVWRTVRAALPEVVRNRGQVLVTSSIYAYMNGMVNSPYAASKAAVEMFTRSLRVELGRTGASASVLYPGWVATPLVDMAFGGNDQATEIVDAAFPAPLRQPIAPEKVAQAVVRGLRSRRARIVVPRRWLPLDWLRGIGSIVTDWHLRRHPRIQELVQELADGKSA
jgi:NAD(P)-dependent dehydrogenase (short-subunit alcohol dehydrogenase family)